MNQKKFTLELISEVGLSGSKPAITLLEMNKKLTTVEYDAATGVSDDPELEDILSYQKLNGKLLYLTITRPGICFAVQVLSQFMQRPKHSYMDSTLRIMRYLKGAPSLGILLPLVDITTMIAYCDADWGACPNIRRSITGYVVMLGSSLVSWKSKKQHTVSRSSAETEYRIMTTVTAEII